MVDANIEARSFYAPKMLQEAVSDNVVAIHFFFFFLTCLHKRGREIRTSDPPFH
jgi:hypothetical protein